MQHVNGQEKSPGLLSDTEKATYLMCVDAV